MENKPILWVVHNKPLIDLPDEAFSEFKDWVLKDKLKHSTALRKQMEKYNCQNADSSLPISLIKYMYPDLDFVNTSFTFRIHDSGYPSSKYSDYTDEDFDRSVEELLSMPPVDYS